MANSSQEGLVPGSKEKISSYQAVLLIITFIISTADILLPAFVAQESGSDSWLAVLAAIPVAVVFAFLIAWLGFMHPGMGLKDILEKNFGRILGRLFLFVFILYLLLVCALVLRQTGSIMDIAFLPETPIEVILILTVLLVIFAVYHGIETISRTNELLLPLGIGILMIVVVFSANQMDFYRLFPVLTEGLLPIYQGGLLIMVWLGEALILLPFNPYLNNPKKMLAGAPLAMVLLGSGLLLGTLAIALFGAEVTANMTFPALEMARLAELSNIFRRFDALLVGVWFGGIFIKLSVAFFFLVKLTGEITGAHNKRFLILPLAVLITALSRFITPTFIDVRDFLNYIFPVLAIPVEFLLPLLLAAVVLVRRVVLRQE